MIKADFSVTVMSRLVELLRANILSGAYPQGSPLRQDVLAAQLGISKIPLREALTALEGEGLVLAVPRRGYIVTPLSAEEAREIFDLRQKIEPLAVLEGMRLASPEDRARLKKILADLNKATKKSDISLISELNRAFHLGMCVPERHVITGRIMNNLMTLSQRYVQIYLSPQGRDKDAQGEHQQMFDAWSSGDETNAVALVARHITETRDALMLELSERPVKTVAQA